MDVSVEIKTVIGIIDRIRQGGNAIVNQNDGHINLGQMSDSKVGMLAVKTENDEIAALQSLPDQVNKKELWKKLIDANTYSSFHPFSAEGDLIGERVTLTPQERMYEYDKIEGIDGVPIDSYRGRTVFILGQSSLNEVEVKITSSSPLYAIGHQVQAEASKEEHKEETADTSKSDTESHDLDTLLKKAQDDAVSEVTNSANTSRRSTSQYNRSEHVKNYVKARADGKCEGCGKEAPFTSKTGEPYLHAHHIYELSDGGSDEPDTVIALCPNCHYRVHHGKDGEKYNQYLLETVQELEE